MMSRRLVLPPLFDKCGNVHDIPKKTIFVGYSDMHGRFPVTFKPLPIQDDEHSWPVLQYDRESCHGTVIPRDMIFGFVVVKYLPHWNKIGGAQAAFERLTAAQGWSSPMEMPPLDKLERLKAGSWIQDGQFIVLVRTPRPYGSRNVIPTVRRTDIQALHAQLAVNPDDPVANSRLKMLMEKSRNETPHPTEAQLFLTKSGALVQAVSPRIVCTRCMAKGHHMAHTHDEVLAGPIPNVTTTWPSWMNIKPMPDEKLELPPTEDSKGFEVQIRQVKAHVPLRLARQMKLRGMEVQGDVVKCGVMEVDSDASSE
jgi:hypothetical protein